jgi:hypothetical protein
VKPESAMWKRLRSHLVAAKLDPVRVENPIHPGTPDVNLADGRWIELKTIEAWRPPGHITPIRHFTPQQRVWLYRRWKYAPGSTYLLLEVRAERQWLLFDGDVAAKIVGRATTDGHRANARAVLVERELSELPKIFAEVVRTPLTEPSVGMSVCTGALVHDEFTVCPVHDAGAGWR